MHRDDERLHVVVAPEEIEILGVPPVPERVPTSHDTDFDALDLLMRVNSRLEQVNDINPADYQNALRPTALRFKMNAFVLLDNMRAELLAVTEGIDTYTGDEAEAFLWRQSLPEE